MMCKAVPLWLPTAVSSRCGWSAPEKRNAFLSVDGGRALRLGAGDVVQISRSAFETQLVRLKDRSFYDILGYKFKKLIKEQSI